MAFTRLPNGVFWQYLPRRPRQETDRSVTDLGRAAGGTDIAADTAKDSHTAGIIAPSEPRR